MAAPALVGSPSPPGDAVIIPTSSPSAQPAFSRTQSPGSLSAPSMDAAIRKPSKSRNGCVTCKARRVKCDETKPSCNQCARRRIECGGYKLDVRFRPNQRPKSKSGRIQEIQAQPTVFEAQETSFASTSPNRPHELLNTENRANSDLSHWSLPDFGDLDTLLSGFDPGAEPPTYPSLETLEQFFSDDFRQSSSHLFDFDISDPGGTNDALAIPISPSFGDEDRRKDQHVRSPSLIQNDNHTLYKGPEFQADSPEKISHLFHSQTCNILSIQDDPNDNPWRTIVWPLVRDHPALYHAIASMTCIHMSKVKPELRPKGIEHSQASTQALSRSMSKGDIDLEIALAATLALGFAETFDFEKCLAGTNHINGAKILLQQALATQHRGNSTERLNFLANTWIYMDVIARLTSDSVASPSSDFTISPNLLDPSCNQDLDPLMGYATTLFPTIGLVADLVARVRNNKTKRNSPAIISKAIDLKRALEDWTLPVDLEDFDETTSNMTDAIQTAEAYRWATLLLLYEAVPELPNRTSYGELSQKVLIYIATTPLTSRTIIIHTFPLMVAGCEAASEEDRDFVRHRWKMMSKSMITGIVDRCLEVTEEVWKRRDEYWANLVSLSRAGAESQRSPRNTFNGYFENIAASLDSGPFGLSPNDDQTSPPDRNREGSSYRNTRPRTRSVPSDFPWSAAFKKGVDTLTRSGCTEYTVKGRLHWLGVMKDWNWQVMLG